MNIPRILLLVVAVVLVAGVAVLAILGLLQKAKYDSVREELMSELGPGLNVATLDQAKLDEVNQWHVHSSAVGEDSPFVEALRTLGKAPTVNNLVDLYSFQMQPYAWLDWSRNKQNLETAAILAVIMPVTADGKVHLSEDRSTVIIFHSDDLASVTIETKEGLRDELRQRDPPDEP